MPDHDAPPQTRPRLTRRTLLGALALAPALPWLAQAARARGGDDDDDDSRGPTGSRLLFAAPLPRRQHTATPLGGGYVLLAGGLSTGGTDEGALADVQVLGPDGSLYAASPLQTPRYGHAAVRIGGRVVVLGGYGQGPLADVEAYDPDGDTWTTLAPLDLPRFDHDATHVGGGKVLLTGGVFQSVLSDTELYAL